MSAVNLTITIPDQALEVSINGEPHILVRKAALDALYSITGAGDRVRVNPVTRAASRPASRPAPKKAPSPRLPVARPAAAPPSETGEPENGTLRAAVLAEIERNPGITSLEMSDLIQKKIPTATSGSCYTAIKSWVAKGLVEGRPTEPGPKGWYPVGSARRAAGGNTIASNGQVPNPAGTGPHPATSGTTSARGAV